MPITNIDSDVAIQSLVEILQLNHGELDILQGGDVEDQISYIATLPQAEGIITYDSEKGKLFLIKEEH